MQHINIFLKDAPMSNQKAITNFRHHSLKYWAWLEYFPSKHATFCLLCKWNAIVVEPNIKYVTISLTQMVANQLCLEGNTMVNTSSKCFKRVLWIWVWYCGYLIEQSDRSQKHYEKIHYKCLAYHKLHWFKGARIYFLANSCTQYV